MRPELKWPEGYAVPDCPLSEDDIRRSQSVSITRAGDGWDIRVSLPILLQLSDEALEGQSLAERADEIAKNAGTILTNDLWLDLVPLIKEKLLNATKEEK